LSKVLLTQAADAIVSTGMQAAGYPYVVIDDRWQVDRGPAGNIVLDAKHFPSGMTRWPISFTRRV
jgi:alpha-galactosidase